MRIISVFATHQDGSLAVPRLRIDRKLLQSVSAGRIIICGSRVAEELPKSSQKLVISRPRDIDGNLLDVDYNEHVHKTMQNLEDREYVVFGGHRIYDIANSFADTIVHVKVAPNTPLADKYSKDEYGYVKWEKLQQTLVRHGPIEEFVNITDDNLSGHEVFIYTNWKSPEMQHTNIINDILKNGSLRSGRNGLTKALFSRQMIYDVHVPGIVPSGTVKLPVSTMAGTWIKGLTSEFEMFIRGETDSKTLERQGVNIWRDNTKDTDGIIGPCYGHNYRNYGGTYDKTGHTRDGIDQLEQVISNLIAEPGARRHIILNYDPRVNSQCPLPPCQMFFQFFVRNVKDTDLPSVSYLDVMSMNRSSDVCCAGLWNTAFTTLLLAYVSNRTGISPGCVIIQLNDVHIYENQFHLAEGHIERTGLAEFPIATVNVSTTDDNSEHYITDIKITVRDRWAYWPQIKYPMSA